MAFRGGVQGTKVSAEDRKKLSSRAINDLMKKKSQENVALAAVDAAQKELHMVNMEQADAQDAEIEGEMLIFRRGKADEIRLRAEEVAAIPEQNVKLCDTAIEELCKAVVYNRNLSAAYFWRAEAYRIRAMCHRNDPGKEKSRTEGRRVAKLKQDDLRASLADCDHCLRFYSPDCSEKQQESMEQSWIVWQLRGRVRAALFHKDFVHDFQTATTLEPTCAMTYILWARCLWRQAGIGAQAKFFDQAILKFEEGLKYPHNPLVKAQMLEEIAECRSQKKMWEEWEAEEAERCAPCQPLKACSIM